MKADFSMLAFRILGFRFLDFRIVDFRFVLFYGVLSCFGGLDTRISRILSCFCGSEARACRILSCLWNLGMRFLRILSCFCGSETRNCRILSYFWCPAVVTTSKTTRHGQGRPGEARHGHGSVLGGVLRDPHTRFARGGKLGHTRRAEGRRI